MTTPKVTEMKVIPVAGYDSMEMTLSGAHAPFFTRNIVILKDSANHTGIGEIHGGEYTKECLESYIPLVVGKKSGSTDPFSAVSIAEAKRHPKMMERASRLLICPS